jgi:AraC-like DNA-binding protein
MQPGAPERLEESDMPSAGVREERVTVARELRPFVESFSFVEAIGARRVFLPDTFARILIVTEPGARACHAYVVGPRAGTMRKEAVRQEAISLRLWPGAVPALMAIPTVQVAATIVPLDAVWGNAGKELTERLGEAPTRARQVAILERAIAGRVRRLAGPRIVPRALAAFDDLELARVSAVAQRVGVSERHLRRMFRDTVGLSPKAYVRVRRLRRALALARRSGSQPWTRVAVDAGYFDQAHMVAEFRDLTGRSPTTLWRELGDP